MNSVDLAVKYYGYIKSLNLIDGIYPTNFDNSQIAWEFIYESIILDLALEKTLMYQLHIYFHNERGTTALPYNIWFDTKFEYNKLYLITINYENLGFSIKLTQDLLKKYVFHKADELESLV